MSRFDQSFTRGAEMLAVNNGSTVIYTQPDANPVTLTQAMVGMIETREDFDAEGGRTLRRMRSLTISIDPASAGGGIAAPTKRDDVEIDGERWSVESVRMYSGNLVTLELAHVGRIELTRPGFRGPR